MRRRRALEFVFLTVAILLATAAPAIAVPAKVSSGELVEQNQRFNGRPVVYGGEVIGDVMFRGRHAWININDDAYSSALPGRRFKLSGYNSGQSVWLPAGQARKVKIAGDYNHRGDTVRVVGVFHRACPEHGGDMDIHASSLEVIKPGRVIDHPVDRRRLQLAAVLLLGAGLVAAIRYQGWLRPRSA